MTDGLVAELRVLAEYVDACGDAADALEAKDKRIAELKTALKEALDYIDDPYDELAIQIGALLDRAAMEGK